MLQAVNSELVHAAPLGQFHFGITLDGTYVRDTITRSFAENKFDKKVQLITGYNLHEVSPNFLPLNVKWRGGVSGPFKDDQLVGSKHESFPM